MASIKIRNIGPIKEAAFDLNKINVFMGPQSSGKSTIAKICSQCSWCEKNFLLTGDEYDFYSGLLKFHRMDKEYFSEDSEIIYESEWVTITFDGIDKQTYFTKKKNAQRLYKNLKIEYVPAERNFVASIPNLGKYNEEYDNIANFLDDWNSFKETITKKGDYSIPLDTMDISYKYDPNTREDIITLANEKNILLQRASSGQQSIIPLLVVCEFMITELYTKKRNPSSIEQNYIKDKLSENMRADYDWVIKEERHPHKSNSTQDKELLIETKNKIWKEIGFSPDYKHSHVIIEEPEQNLFPETQKELIYHILNKVNHKQRDHQLILTTHSPYVLYALNNCMLGGLVEGNIPKDEQDEFQSKSSWIDPKSVSVWEIEDGCIRDIQDKDNIISENYFDTKMTELTDEYFQILNYYQDEE